MKKREGKEYIYRDNGMILSKKVYNNKNGKLSNMEIYDYLGSVIYSLHIEDNNIYHEKVNHPLLKYIKINGKYNGMYEEYECEDESINLNIKTDELLIDKILNTCDINYKNIKLVKKCFYEDNILNGIYIECKNGEIIKECNYNNNKLDGEYKEYNMINELTLVCNYKNNLLNGDYIKYNGKHSWIKKHYINNILNGEYIEFINNILIKKCYYYDNLLNGEYNEYDILGNIKLKKKYDYGILTGECIFYNNYKISCYDNDYYKIYKNIYIKCNYIDGEFDGEYIKYDKNNNINIKCNYNYGKLHGEYIEKENNQIIKHFNYNNGNLCLENIQYHKNSKNKIFMIKIFNNNNILIESKLYSKNGNLVYNRYIDNNNNIIEIFNHPIISFLRKNCIIQGKYKEFEYKYYSENYTYDYYDTIFNYELTHSKLYNNNNFLLTKYCIYDDNGDLDNIYKEYDDNGQLILFCNYHHGKLYGEYKVYNNKGKLIIDCNYYNNILHGKYIKYNIHYPDYIHIDSNYLFGKLDDDYKEYFLDSFNLKLSCKYNNGMLHGEYKKFYYNIEILSCNYNFNKLHGEFLLKNKNNQILKHCYYKNGDLDGEYKEYNNGILIKERNYINNILNGKFKEYDTDGDLILDLYYKNDLPIKKPLTFISFKNKCSIKSLKICFIEKLNTFFKPFLKNNKIDVI